MKTTKLLIRIWERRQTADRSQQVRLGEAVWGCFSCNLSLPFPLYLIRG